MKPTAQQQKSLQQHLGKNLKYRETYFEFYDHILSALETRPDNGEFDDASHKIMAEDFGGDEGMRLIENKYPRSVFAEMQKKYFGYAVKNVKFPMVIGVAAFGIVIYYLVTRPWFTFMEYLILLVFIRFIPVLLRLSGPKDNYKDAFAPKKSIKSGFFAWLGKGWTMVISFGLIWDSNSYRNVDHERAALMNIVMVVVCLVIALHSFNFYKVYRDDIKTSFKYN